MEKFFEFLNEKGFTFTKESTFEEYLGIKYIHLENGLRTSNLVQNGLIQKILEATNLTECHPNK